MTKEPKLERARRQVPEWTVYDDEIAEVERRWKESDVVKGDAVKVDESLVVEEVVNTKSRTLEVEKPHTRKDEL